MLCSYYYVSEVKPMTTPVIPRSKLSIQSEDLLQDVTLYRQIVGCLQYLTMTHPDISYATNQVAQFRQAPSTPHFQVAKRILPYTKGMIQKCLIFKNYFKNATN